MSLPPFARTTGESFSIIPFSSLIALRSPPSSVHEVWGDDAHVFNPRRYITGHKKEGVPTVGVYGDVLTFCGYFLLDLLQI